MLDDTLLLAVYGLMIVAMTSGANCHTSIHIQSDNHTHTSIHIQSCNDVAHGYMKHSYEKLYLSLVSAPATHAVYESDG